jgi:hypothetical protein
MFQDFDQSASLMAAISYLDSWAYMIHNADESTVPNVDGTIPPVSVGRCGIVGGTSQDFGMIACDPKNQNWIQGAPAVYLNNEAPLHARSLDAIAMAVRSCCDQANNRFAILAKEAANEAGGTDDNHDQQNGTDAQVITPTMTAVMSNENELCSRNMILSAYTLMQQHNNKGLARSVGQSLIISAMDAFLENSDEEGTGFTDSQIQSLLSVCNTTLENPLLLHHAGPTYHMVSNAAILLCHLLNGMYAMHISKGSFDRMERTLFEEVLDTFIPIRKLLTIHRRKLPVRLRCHGIPRPNIEPPTGTDPFIDLGETLLCACRGCQGFVLMACSPCVAAERAQSVKTRLQVEAAQEAQAAEMGVEDDDDFAEFDLDDDQLLGMISSLVSS